MAVDYPLWLGIDKTGISAADSISAELSLLNIASPGYIRTLDSAGATVTPLVTTSKDGGTVPVSAGAGADRSARCGPCFQAGREAAGSCGQALGRSGQRFFPKGRRNRKRRMTGSERRTPKRPAKTKRPRPRGEALKAAHLARSTAPMDVIAVADVDMLADPMWMVENALDGGRTGQAVADNAAFFLNAVENMTGRDDLVSLRSRGSFQRPFTLVEDLRREAESRHRAKEKELLDRLDEALRRLSRLERDPSAEEQVVLTPAQTESLKGLRADVIRLRRELRDVQHRLRSDVEALTSRLELVNIALVPALVAVFRRGGRIRPARPPAARCKRVSDAP